MMTRCFSVNLIQIKLTSVINTCNNYLAVFVLNKVSSLVELMKVHNVHETSLLSVKHPNPTTHLNLCLDHDIGCYQQVSTKSIDRKQLFTQGGHHPLVNC